MQFTSLSKKVNQAMFPLILFRRARTGLPREQ